MTEPDTEHVVEVRGLRKSFGTNVVFDGLDLDVRRGEFMTLIGGSGSGKSLLLKSMLGLSPVDAGSILFEGEELLGDTDEGFRRARENVGMLFQASALFDSLDVYENIAYALRQRGERDEAMIDATVSDSLRLIGLPGIERMWPADLSGGMKKRVALARAVAVRPKVIFYDEPTEGLDPINVTRVNRLLLGLSRTLDATTVVVTHNMESAFSISDRVAMLFEGRIIGSGTPAEMRAVTDRRVREFVDAVLDSHAIGG